jgi:hypothetical protein
MMNDGKEDLACVATGHKLKIIFDFVWHIFYQAILIHVRS